MGPRNADWRVRRGALAAHAGHHGGARGLPGELRAQAPAGQRERCPVEIEAFLQEKAAKVEKADFIFMDLDKPMYAGCYTLIMENELLAEGGIMLCDNVLYRGLTAQHYAGEMPSVSKKTAANAAAMEGFLGMVRADTEKGKVRSLMMPVRDGMLALQTQ